MASDLNFSLSDDMKQWLDSQVVAGGFASTDDFLNQLLLKERQQRVRDAVERELLAALDDGPSEPLMAADWEEIRNGREQRLQDRRAS